MKLTKTTFFPGCLTGGAVAALVAPLITSTQADTKLLPFQGRLTNASGTAIADGAKVVEFKMVDAPTGGNVNGREKSPNVGSKEALQTLSLHHDPSFNMVWKN